MDFDKLLRNYFWPLFLTLLPFFPNIYTWIVEDEDIFIYSYKYEKNPVIEWNRQISEYLKQLNLSSVNSESVSNVLLKRIGRELVSSMPAILAGSGYKPLDSMEVSIANLSQSDIKNIRIHFLGCKGYDSHKSYPDQFSEVLKPNPKDIRIDDVTIRYDSLARSGNYSHPVATITFYGQDASECTPTLSAVNHNGESIPSKYVKDIYDYQSDLYIQDYERDKKFDFIFKLLTGLAFVYFYIKIRNFQRKNQ